MITYNEKIRKIRDYSFIQQLNNVLSEAKSVPELNYYLSYKLNINIYLFV